MATRRMLSFAKTIGLTAAVLCALTASGYTVAGPRGAVLAAFLGCLWAGAGYLLSIRLVLRLHDARPLTSADAPRAAAAVQRLAMQAGILTPRLYLIPESAPNAMAVGRGEDHAAIAVTEGLLRACTEQEIKAVLAQLIVRIRDREIVPVSVGAVFASACNSVLRFATWGSCSGFGLTFLGCSDACADAEAVRLTHNPEALLSALKKIEQGAGKPFFSRAPETGPLFVVNPENLRATGMEARLASLRAMVRVDRVAA